MVLETPAESRKAWALKTPVFFNPFALGVFMFFFVCDAQSGFRTSKG
jgi:hypothetical protein